MALFSRKKTDDTTDETAVVKQTAKQPAKQALVTDRDLSSVLIAPRVTEKAVRLGEKNVYTFIVRPHATKFDVRDAVKAQFGVTPVKVNIVNKTARAYKSRRRNQTVTEKGMRKAYVYLQAGDSIELA